MKKRVGALLLALVLVLGLAPAALGAEGAAMAVAAVREDGETTVTVTLSGAEGVTNGRVQVTYPAEYVTLQEVTPGSEDWVFSVNDGEEGTVAFAWVGSVLTGEEETVVTLLFADVEDADPATVDYEAACGELYASGEAVDVKTARATVVYRGSPSIIVTPPSEQPGEEPSEQPGDEPGEQPGEEPGDEPAAPSFVDIADHWAEEDIEKIHAAGLVNGTGDGTTFEPESPLDRAMFAVILFRAKGEPAGSPDAGFTDVAAGSWYADAVNWALAEGVTTGTGDGTTYSPATTINREQLVTMLYRYAAKEGKDVSQRADLSSFRDAGSVSGWAADAMSWAVANGYITGTDAGTLIPQSDATRAQMATILVRYLDL